MALKQGGHESQYRGSQMKRGLGGKIIELGEENARQPNRGPFITAQQAMQDTSGMKGGLLFGERGYIKSRSGAGTGPAVRGELA